ncbi:flagellar assembly peptidoglycan hydrolase FlgJ [Vreelandella rituensis]|uniref:Peptidoglycan hydrolase FlgJ n=1 Tax=Vreelandella rituensis TaxID=2282306 RepID=A0A368TRN3_9GAMM|nr:flagellar assembly peptidoglycan hydrolase FlgJ [Halomonas rituensis]RCV86996.1 flagellar assembly peptidoglycan hydrolase FlgJ [Halomonas rituensis]
MSVQDVSNQFALDMQGLQRLQHTARMDPEAGVKGAAQQFEALFIQMMMKSMRDAIPASGLMNSRETDTFQSMLDKQWSQTMASRGMGLADALVEQLEHQGVVTRSGEARQVDSETQALIAGIPRGTPRVLDEPLRTSGMAEESQVAAMAKQSSFLDELATMSAGASSTGSSSTGASSDNAVTAALPEAGSLRDTPQHIQEFIDRLAKPAQAASSATGVPAELILAQAALETGWGRHEIATSNGGNSHNLFGIKAGSQWQGKTTDVVTHEYINGRRTQVVDSFRAYDSFEQAFTDYAGLIGNNSRYAAVLDAPDAQQAAHALQQGGYATDPRYADKLIAVMSTMGPLSAGGDFLADSR